jgi:hypothetical protein
MPLKQRAFENSVGTLNGIPEGFAGRDRKLRPKTE